MASTIERPHLVIATPAYGGLVTTAYTSSMLRLRKACIDESIELTWFLVSGDALITRARADLVARFLDLPSATHLLFIDADIGFEPEQVLRMMRFDAEVTAGAYPVKQFDWSKVRRVLDERRPRPESASLTYVLGFEDPKKLVIRDRFAKVRYAGNGFLMLRRAALERMCAAHPELRYKSVHALSDPLKDSEHRVALFDCMIDPETGTYLSEDYAFCQRWTKMGGEIWLDLESRLVHVGPMRFVGDLTTQFGR